MWADILLLVACGLFVTAMARDSKPWFWVGLLLSVVAVVGYYGATA